MEPSKKVEKSEEKLRSKSKARAGKKKKFQFTAQ
jgi:hypothetical protein